MEINCVASTVISLALAGLIMARPAAPMAKPPNRLRNRSDRRKLKMLSMKFSLCGAPIWAPI